MKNFKFANADQLLEALSNCKTQDELDFLLIKNILLWYNNKDIQFKIDEFRYKIIKKQYNI